MENSNAHISSPMKKLVGLFSFGDNQENMIFFLIQKIIVFPYLTHHEFWTCNIPTLPLVSRRLRQPGLGTRGR